MKEKEKMSAGFWYYPMDEQLNTERMRAEELCYLFNQINPQNHAQKEALLRQLLPHCAQDVIILGPFYTDYGYHCFIKEGTFINRGAYLMDGAKITIGKHCFIGPNCGMYTASHPIAASIRRQGFEKAGPITIGDDVWIGGNTVILPGVVIGQKSVIGAGSVVTGNIPEQVVAFGNPCRVIRSISEDDSLIMPNEQ